ncbi:hypothetical protein CYY_006422 [Polysphondylium violaceum]|uniref:Uncharacterized protein n=1 Tax=Polysphondylium violaceum TaxID=133409 RepID=A0A8J4UZ02_9MYCE|nr:hypothetical protein CYY_006422 [Polysphondylium violaceum]
MDSINFESLNVDKEKQFIELLNNSSDTDKLSLFFNLQEQRISVNNRFNEGFKLYLENQNDQEYQKNCNTITGLISSISKEIIQIENSLYKTQPNWSKTIKTIRDLEKQKFILTTKYQILRSEIVGNEELSKHLRTEEQPTGGSCLYEHIETCQEQLSTCKNEMNKIINDINEKLEELRYELTELNAQTPQEEIKVTGQCSHAGHDHDHHHH